MHSPSSTVTKTLPRARVPAPKPRLRFDKGALGLVSRLRAALSDEVPDGKLVMVTVTAPIRQDSKTGAVLEERVRKFLARGSARSVRARPVTDIIHGNRIEIRLLEDCPAGAARVIGFVHNPEPGPAALFELTQAMLTCMSSAMLECEAASPAGAPRLVIDNRSGFEHFDIYQHIYWQLRIPSGFKQVLMEFPDGVREVLRRREPTVR